MFDLDGDGAVLLTQSKQNLHVLSLTAPLWLKKYRFTERKILTNYSTRFSKKT